jgi:hypothetical protein
VEFFEGGVHCAHVSGSYFRRAVVASRSVGSEKDIEVVDEVFAKSIAGFVCALLMQDMLWS